MDKHALLEEEYLKEKRLFEEKEDNLILQRDEGIRDLEAIGNSAQYHLKDYVPDQSLITQALHNLDSMKEEVYEAAQHDRRQIERETETLEENYHRAIRKLSDEEMSEKVSEV